MLKAIVPLYRFASTLARSLALSLFFAGVAFAQGSITGKVIDPQNKPVAKLEVLLHAVTGSTGQQVDRDTTDAEGQFKLNVGTVKDSAIYFVAVIWNGQLYVGDMMRPPFPANKDYVVQVGVNPVDAGPAAAQAPNVGQAPVETPTDRKAGTIVVIVAALAIAGVLYFALRRRPPARRRWLVELARIEDEIETSGTSDALQRRRAELRERLRAPQGS